ncbi:MAG: DUF4349 domain-containing protein [Chloroflexota bacterium]
MKKKRRFLNILLCLIILMGIGLAACGGASFEAAEVDQLSGVRVVTEVVEVEGESMFDEEMEEESFDDEAMDEEFEESGEFGPESESPQPQQRLIIKDGKMTVTVDDTETAVTQATDTVVTLGGYIINQNVFDNEQGYRFATMRLGVPVDNFETALKALRELGTVTNESASGVDVTDEFVDLNSRLENLIPPATAYAHFCKKLSMSKKRCELMKNFAKWKKRLQLSKGASTF